MSRTKKKIITFAMTAVLVLLQSMVSFAGAVDKSFGPGLISGDLFQGEELMMLANQTASQMESFVITTKNGKLIVVDGGVDGDAEHLVQTILSKGGRVSAWFITHPHSDHVGALTKIINDGLYGITIDAVYYSYTNIEWYQENEPNRAQMVLDSAAALSRLPEGTLHSNVHKGDVITIDDVTVTVMNDIYLIPNNAINNSSIVYKMEMGGRKIMFLGDLAYDGGKKFLEEHQGENLRCDIVQLAHHGENGVDLELYKRLSPKVALWCTPQWLWDNDNGGGAGSGSWPIEEVKSWMKSIGVTYNYCIKDGDQILK